MPITYDKNSHRFRAENGRFIKTEYIADQLQKVRDGAEGRIKTLTQTLIDGKINLPAWQIAMRDEIKALHLTHAAAARGGLKQMTLSDLGKLGAKVKPQYAFLDNFAREIEAGKTPTTARAAMYARAAYSTFVAMDALNQTEEGKSEGRRITTSGESCPDCVEYAGRGWMPVEEIPAIGDSVCRVNCRCYVEYR